MLTTYLDAAIHRSSFEPLEGDEGWFATTTDFPGLWANGKTVEEARDELRSALEGWIILALREGEVLPILNGNNLTSELPARQAS